jgi:hypothetical protein
MWSRVDRDVLDWVKDAYTGSSLSVTKFNTKFYKEHARKLKVKDGCMGHHVCDPSTALQPQTLYQRQDTSQLRLYQDPLYQDSTEAPGLMHWITCNRKLK